MNTIHYLKIPWFVTKLPNHTLIKNTILNLIEEEDSGYTRRMNEEIVYTDYKPDNGLKIKKYFNCIEQSIKDTVQPIFEELGFLPPLLKEVWFQQYFKNYFHGVHNHSGADWTNIYYVELPANLTTKIEFFTSGVTFTPEVSEGCILTIPGIIPHYSIKNLNNSLQRKTVIVFNVNTSFNKDAI